MKSQLGLKAVAVFLFFSALSHDAMARNKKVCVRVVEHTPQFLERDTQRADEDIVDMAKEQEQTPSLVSQSTGQQGLTSDSEANRDPSHSPSSQTNEDKSHVSKTELETAGARPMDQKTDRNAASDASDSSPPRNSGSRATFPLEPPIGLSDSIENTNIPLGQSALKYLQRLLEHFVTHEPGYVAVAKGCEETVNVELYPLNRGWTAFSRYSGTGREERVDQLFPTELSMYAERVVLALLHDVPISATINRENVLKADSMKSVQRIRGRSHFVLAVGAQFRMGMLPTWNESVDKSAVAEELRPLFPVKFSLGYRGRFESWGIEAVANLGLGTSAQVGVNDVSYSRTLNLGHVDYGGDTGLALHFLRYFDPRGLTSFYLGSGATFEMLWFRVIEGNDDDRSTLFSGGLNVDGVFGWEFMRASAVQFLLQGELNVPAYFIRSSNDEATLKTWLPGFTIKIGMVF